MRWPVHLIKGSRYGALWDDAASTPHTEMVAALVARRRSTGRPRLGSTLSVLHADTGGCNASLLELHALANTPGLLARFGLRFVASPLHADVLLLTGPGSRNMRTAIAQVWQAMPGPRWTVLAGDAAIDGGELRDSYAHTNGIGDLPLDLVIPGSPPAPGAILSGLRALLAANSG